MSIIEQATKRLEELTRAGVEVPWAAAGLSNTELQARVTRAAHKPAEEPTDRHGAEAASISAPHRFELLQPGADELRPPTSAGRVSEHVELDLDRLERAGYLSPNKGRSELAEEFRHIKRPLLRSAHAADAGPRASVIMVTSALPGEGKTFTSVNLALSIAMEIDSSVLLVDADVVRPGLPDRLGFDPKRRGLLDLLADPALEMADVMLKTNVPKLSIVPAGTPSARSTELLASAAMEALLEDISRRYAERIIIFDAPPLLLTTEAKVLASRVGQVIVVVEAERTSRHIVAQAFAAVANCDLVMSVLNRCHRPREMPPYGDYYG
jgi:exopolysaccharide/PEP-CTERM locus tyrosine autokinase